MPVTFNATGNSTSEGCGDGSSDNTVMLGITIGLISSVAINLGQNIQALGAKEAGADQNPCSSRRWVKRKTRPERRRSELRLEHVLALVLLQLPHVSARDRHLTRGPMGCHC